MEVLSSRVLLRPRHFERSLRFYAETLGLRVYREYGSGEGRGVVFFLGGGFLELSGSGSEVTPDSVGIWLQVPDLAATEADLVAGGVEVTQGARLMPWGLLELWAKDPDGLRLVFVEVPQDHPLRRRA